MTTTGSRMPSHVGVGTAAIVVREGRVLLGERRGAHGAGTWAFPGGKVDPGEDPAETVVRELREETGLEAIAVRPLAWTNDLFVTEGLHYVTLHHRIDVAAGEPQVREPDKCRRWAWFAWDALPAPLFVPVANLAAQGWRPA